MKFFKIGSLPNLISLGRLILVPAIISLIAAHRWKEAFICFIIAGASDALDGWIAKTFDLRTQLGAYLDPLLQRFGVPASAIFLEPAANDTIHNACYSARIMKAHGWRSAEVIAGAAHLPRAGMIFSHTGLDWRAHAAPSLEPASSGHGALFYGSEVLKTARYLLYAQWAETCSP